jgi:low affinity Fe/Cu permease
MAGRARRVARRTTTKRATRERSSMGDRFRAAADAVTNVVGTPWAMIAAALVVAAWAVTGPIFGFSDTWQLVINTGTTIVTFLMVFAIQTSQNHDARVTQLKLDELIRALPQARNERIADESKSEQEIEREEAEFKREAHA